MLTTCPDPDNDRSLAVDANADDADDNATHDPALDVTPDGTPRCKNVDAIAHAPPRNARNNPADHTAAPENLRTHNLGADPRAPTPSQLLRWLVLADAAGNADAARDDTDARLHWPDNDGSTSPDANAGLTRHIHCCNNGFADDSA